MSYSGAGQANIVPVESDPRKLFARLFTSTTPGDGGASGAGGTSGMMSEMDRLAVQRKSVLDTAIKDFERLKAKLGGVDRQRVEKHLDLVRQVEQTDPDHRRGWRRRRQRRADAAPRVLDAGVADVHERSGQGQRSASGARQDDDGPDGARLGLRHHARRFAACGRRASPNTTSPRSCRPRPGRTCHVRPTSTLAPTARTCPRRSCTSCRTSRRRRRTGCPANLNTVQKAALECLTVVEEWFSQQLAYFVQKLADLKEADGSSILDNTVLLSLKDISEGVTHGYRDVPHVIIGGKGLFKPGHVSLQNRKTSGRPVRHHRAGARLQRCHELRRSSVFHRRHHRNPGRSRVAGRADSDASEEARHGVHALGSFDDDCARTLGTACSSTDAPSSEKGGTNGSGGVSGQAGTSAVGGQSGTGAPAPGRARPGRPATPEAPRRERVG